MGRARHHAGAGGRRASSIRWSATSRITCTRAGAAAIRSCTRRRVPVAVAYWLLWNPPAGLSHEALFAYFVVVVGARAGLHRGLRDPERVAGARADRPLRRAHLDPELSLLLRLVGRARDGRARVRGLPAARRRAPGRRAEPGGLRHATASPRRSSCCARSSSPRSARTPTSRISSSRRRSDIAGLAGAFRRARARRSRTARSWRCSAPASSRAMAGGLIARARHLLQHLLLGADLEPDLDARPRLLRLRRCWRWRSRRGLSRRFGKKRAAIATSLAAIADRAPRRSCSACSASSRRTARPTLLPMLFVVRARSRSRSLIMSGILDLVDGRRHRRGQRGVDRPALRGRLRRRQQLRAEGRLRHRHLRLEPAARRHRLPARTPSPARSIPAVVHRLGLVYAPTIVVLYLIAIAFLATYRISRDATRRTSAGSVGRTRRRPWGDQRSRSGRFLPGFGQILCLRGPWWAISSPHDPRRRPRRPPRPHHLPRDRDRGRLVDEVLAYFSESVEEFVARRHRELQARGPAERRRSSRASPTELRRTALRRAAAHRSGRSAA